jgi:hypothetical protein
LGHKIATILDRPHCNHVLVKFTLRLIPLGRRLVGATLTWLAAGAHPAIARYILLVAVKPICVVGGLILVFSLGHAQPR